MNAEKNIMQGLDMAVAQAIDDPDNTEIQVSLVDFTYYLMQVFIKLFYIQ